jgi:YegS/Rv2252/BmrU family lipid kinase
MFKKIIIIVNPSAGGDEDIVSIIHQKLDASTINWDVRVTKDKKDIKKFINEAIKNKVDAVAVYGGDGTITEATELIYKSSIPLIILPGGTANILAKELNLPLTSAEMLDLLIQKKIAIKKIDIGLINKKPFLLRINFGLFADMIVETDRNLKKTIGQLAYGISAIRKLTDIQPVTYTIKIGRKIIITKGISLMVANSTNIGMRGFSLLHDATMSDGKLDIFLVKNSEIGHITSLLGGALTGTKSEELDHWQAKKVTITVSPSQRILCDDTPFKAKRISIEIIHHAVSLVIPKS